jgi:hypothetical protein
MNSGMRIVILERPYGRLLWTAKTFDVFVLIYVRPKSTVSTLRRFFMLPDAFFPPSGFLLCHAEGLESRDEVVS